MSYQPRNRYGSPQRTAADHRQALKLMLFSCRPHMLDIYTVDSLQRTHSKLSVKEIEYELLIARQKRAGEAR